MRQRHFARLCRACDAPMARQEDSCWRCGVTWSEQIHAARSGVSAPASTERAEPGRLAAVAVAVPVGSRDGQLTGVR